MLGSSSSASLSVMSLTPSSPLFLANWSNSRAASISKLEKIGIRRFLFSLVTFFCRNSQSLFSCLDLLVMRYSNGALSWVDFFSCVDWYSDNRIL